MEKRYIKEKDFVYWVEYDLSQANQYKYVVHSGYYLATYQCNDTDVHIVSLGNITSCVVRHLADNSIFTTKEEAQKKANKLNEIRNK